MSSQGWRSSKCGESVEQKVFCSHCGVNLSCSSLAGCDAWYGLARCPHACLSARACSCSHPGPLGHSSGCSWQADSPGVWTLPRSLWQVRMWRIARRPLLLQEPAMGARGGGRVCIIILCRRVCPPQILLVEACEGRVVAQHVAPLVLEVHLLQGGEEVQWGGAGMLAVWAAPPVPCIPPRSEVCSSPPVHPRSRCCGQTGGCRSPGRGP